MPRSETKRDPRFDAEQRRRARRLYEGGASVQEIADELGISKGRAYVLVLESGAKLRPRGPKP